MIGRYLANPFRGAPRDEIGYPRWPGTPEQDPTEEEIAVYVAEDPSARAFLSPRLLRALVEIERSNPRSPVCRLWKQQTRA